MPHSVEELRQEIHAAFAARPYPGDDKIALRKPDCPVYEGEDTWRLFQEKDWREILRIGRGRDLRTDMSFLTFEGFVYYLPAFLELSLDLRPPFDVDDSLVFKLWSFPEEIATLLRPGERRAVVHVLEFLSAEYDKRGFVRNDAAAALDHFWAYFTDEELGLI